MTTTLVNVTPITRGYAFTFTLQFTLPTGSALFLPPQPVPSRVRGEFRAIPGPSSTNPILGAVDTADGSLTINSDGSITMSLTEATTASFLNPSICLDFAREDSGVTSAVGAQFQWPVIDPVTAPMT